MRELDSEGDVFSDDERNLIVEYGVQLGNMERTRDLAEHIYAQEKYGNQDVALAVIEARKEIEDASGIVLPDETISIVDMNEYGYQWEKMLPLNRKKALELYRKGVEVQKLYPDDSETYAMGEEDIKEHQGIFGVEKGEWEKVGKKIKALCKRSV